MLKAQEQWLMHCSLLMITISIPNNWLLQPSCSTRIFSYSYNFKKMPYCVIKKLFSVLGGTVTPSSLFHWARGGKMSNTLPHVQNSWIDSCAFCRPKNLATKTNFNFVYTVNCLSCCSEYFPSLLCIILTIKKTCIKD